MDRLELARLVGGSVAALEHRDSVDYAFDPQRVSSAATLAVMEPTGRPVLVEAAQPTDFMAALAGAVASGDEVFLCDANWGEAERAQLNGLLQSEIINRKSEISEGWLMIPTGGTGGRLRFARHDEDTIAAAVRGFARHFGITRVNAAGALPLHHVSGLMAWMRCALTSGEYRPLGWKQLEAGEMSVLPAKPDGWFFSLVPTQLERLLRRPATVEWLRGFRTILLGGGPAWPDLLKKAADAQLPLSLSYGMTETAAMVTALQPHEFLLGRRDSGAALPHAAVEILPDGTVRVGGYSVFHGYWPERRPERWHDTDDLGRLDEARHLHILGRRDEVIITGGEKVNPLEVEAVLLATGEFDDVAVVGVPHPEWGSEVVAVHPADRAPDMAVVEKAFAGLAAFKRPKRLVALPDWPRGEAGKLNRGALAELAACRVQRGG